MPTLSGFTRISDPVVAVDLAAKILADTGKTVTVEVTATDVIVSGTLSESDRTALQSSMNNYYYQYFQMGAPLSDNPDMSGARRDKGVSERVAYLADTAVLAAARRKAWVTGVLKNDSFVYYSKATTSNGGVTFYLTDDGTANGNPVFSNVYADSVTISPYGASAIYQISGIVVSNDKKSITATVNQVNSVVLGLVQIVSSANSIQCNLLVLGD